MTIGNRIRTLRKGLNYSQEYLAEQLNVSPDTKNMIQLAQLLNSTVEYIASGKKDDTVENSSSKENNKISKKQKKIIILVVSVLLFFIMFFTVIWYIHTRPVEWDSGDCSGGYATWIFDKYNKELTDKFLNGMEEEKEKVVSIEAIRGTQNIEYEDRQIFLESNIKYEHKDYGAIEEKVRFIGTRYWIESFKWSGAIIVGE